MNSTAEHLFWIQTKKKAPTEGPVVAVVAYPTFSYYAVPDEWQDVGKYPDRYPYWLPLPEMPRKAP